MSNKKSNNSFIIQGTILAAAGIIVRLIGLVYRVPLNHILGDEGAGIYSSAYNIYTILLLLSSSSLPLAISKIVAERQSKGEYKNVKRVLTVAFIFSFFLGLATFCIIWFGADFFASKVLNYPNAVYALKVLAPTIFIMAFLSTLRGFFQGLGSMIPTALSQIVEQIFNAAFSIICALTLFNMGMSAADGGEALASAYGAAGGTIGTGVGALSAFVVCIIIFILYRKRFSRQVRKDRHGYTENKLSVLKIIVLTALPVTLSGTVTNICTVVDQSIFGHYMTFAGQSAQYMTIWGSYSSVYVLLTTLPIAVANSLAMSTAPSIAAANVNGDRAGVISKIGLSIRFCMIIGIPSTIGLTVLGGPIVKMLFSYNESAGTMLTAGSVVVIFSCITAITSAILQGFGKVMIPVRHAFIALILHFIFLAISLYVFHAGIYGVIFAIIFFNIVTSILNLRYISKSLSYRQEIKKTFLLPLLSSVIMGAICYAVYYGCNKLTGRNTISVLISIVIAVIVYFVLLLLTKSVDEVELRSMKGGTRLVQIGKKLHLM